MGKLRRTMSLVFKVKVALEARFGRRVTTVNEIAAQNGGEVVVKDR